MNLAALGLQDRRPLSSTRLIVAKMREIATRLSDGIFIYAENHCDEYIKANSPRRRELLDELRASLKLIFKGE